VSIESQVLALLAAVLFLPRLARHLRRGALPGMIDVSVLQRRIARAETLTVLDVRGPAEYHGELGHIPGSLNVPLNDLAHRLPELQNLKLQPVVLVCRTDKRSAKAAELMHAAGFRSVEGTHRSTMVELAEWHKWADKVIVF
jgi:rhodanese-related sulfurtransferase